MRLNSKVRLKASLAFIITLSMLLCMIPLSFLVQAATEPGNPNKSPGNGTIIFPEYDLTLL